MSNINS